MSRDISSARPSKHLHISVSLFAFRRRSGSNGALWYLQPTRSIIRFPVLDLGCSIAYLARMTWLFALTNGPMPLFAHEHGSSSSKQGRL